MMQEQGSLKFKSFNPDIIDIYYLFQCRQKRSWKRANVSEPLSSGLRLLTSLQWCEPDLSSKGIKGYYEQYTTVSFYQRQETGEVDVCLNSPTSCPCCHAFYSLVILMCRINRYGWTQWEGKFPLIKLARNNALVKTTFVSFAILLVIQMKVSRKFWWWFHAWLASWVCNLCSCTGPCAYKGPMLCCCHIEISNLDEGPHIFILHWTPQILYGPVVNIASWMEKRNPAVLECC